MDKEDKIEATLLEIEQSEEKLITEKHKFKDRFLKPDVSWKSFWAFLISCMMSIAGLVFINAAQTYVLIDILDYPRYRLGFASGSLAFADEILCVPMVSFWGFLSDKIGRRPIITIGLLFMSLSICLYPWAAEVFPSTILKFFKSLLFYRLIFALGGSATTAMITALIGDYSNETSRAKIAGVVGTFAGLGALIAVLLFTRLPILFSRKHLEWSGFNRPDIVLTFIITSIVLLCTSLASGCFMQSPSLRQRSTQSFGKRLKTGMSSVRKPLIALSYLSGFVARADSIALNLFIGPWVDNYLTKTGVCPPSSDQLVVRCEAAKRLTSNLMSTSHLATLLGAPFFGVISDKLGPVAAVSVPSFLGFVSFGALTLARNPSSPFVYTAMICCGLSDIGMIISSMALISSQSSPNHRGALAGVYSLFGAIGIIVTSRLGGYFFDSISETAPFSIVAVSSAILFGLVISALVFVKQ